MHRHRLARGLAVLGLLLGGLLASTPTARAADSWVPMDFPRGGLSGSRTATPLATGEVLLTGGSGEGDPTFADAGRFDPAAGRWSLAAPMLAGRFSHTATLLPDGRVLVAGGFSAPVGGGLGNISNTAELYNPVADHWSPAAPLGAARQGHTATLLPDGRVLVAGGQSGDYYRTETVASLATVELYDPATGRWTFAAPMRQRRERHTATLLLDGRVLVVGGGSTGAAREGGLADAEIYDPATDAWAAAAPPPTAQSFHTATLLSDGRVLVAGGATAEVYDPVADRWTPTGPLAVRRGAPQAAPLPGGRVLLVGPNAGAGRESPLRATAETYDPATNRWAPAAAMAVAQTVRTATALPDGRVVVTGNYFVYGGQGFGPGTSELYNGGAPAVQCFAETGICLRAAFLARWEATGGLALNGYPISDVLTEMLEDGQPHAVQYFERTRLEYHPENAPPYDVLLGQFGRRVLLARAGQEVAPPVEPLPDRAYFPATGHTLGGRFLEYWEANGGLPPFGFPLTEPFEEALEDGRVYAVQYFERARFELHPENAPPDDVLLGQFGRQILAEVEAGR